MNKGKQIVIIFLLLFIGFSKFYSQINVSPSSGCLPAGLTNAVFTYTGNGSPTNVVWNFGDSTPTSTLLTTQHSYPNVGSYTVTFSALIAGSPVTYTYLVSVNPIPTGNFSSTIPSNHCTPMNVTYTGTSSMSNVVFTWAFGDLAGGSGASTAHIYSSSGTFTPIVTIQNTLTGCFVNIPGTAVHVSTPPNLFIIASPGFFTCAPSFNTSFNVGNSSSGSPLPGGGLNYSWNFGPFGTSTASNVPSIVFSPIGDYTVVLTATDNNNCTASKTETVSLKSPTISVTVPASVCIQPQMQGIPQLFTITVSSSEPTTLWQMGDGTVFNFPFPLPPPQVTPTLSPNATVTSTLYAYITPGLKTLTVTNTVGQCVATATKTIFVEEISPSFTSTPPSYTCSPTFSISYVNQSTVNSSSSLFYSWKVNNWNSTSNYLSTATNPTFLVTQGSLNQYVNYGHPPYYVQAQLEVTSSLGCFASVNHVFDTIQRPTAIFEVDKAEGCVPLSVTFSNASSVNTISAFSSPITSYTWNYGVSPSSTLAGTGSVIPQSTFSYTSPGIYYPTLSISTGVAGCGSVSYPHTITVVNPPAFSYTLPLSPVCAGQTVQVKMAASANSVDHWHVATDYNNYSSCTKDSTPVWRMLEPGVHDYTLSAYKNGCRNEIAIPQGITVTGPMASMVYETNCSGNRKSVNFYYTLKDVSNAIIDFGDNSTIQSVIGTANATVTGMVTHTYSTNGDYTASITSSNSANPCPPQTYSAQVKIRQLQANFQFQDSIICKNTWLTVNALTAVDVYTSCGRGYSWYIDNYPPWQSNTYTHTSTNDYSSVGIHTVTLVVKDINGCTESITKNFRVSSPAPNFTFNANPICFSNMPVQFINLTPQYPETVSNFVWTMGDSAFHTPPVHSTIMGTVPNHSPSFSYLTLGGSQSKTFIISLYATNSLGCTSHTRIPLIVNNPSIKVLSDYSGCIPSSKNFTIQASSTHTNYNINYGDGSSTNLTSYTNNATYLNNHLYTTAGTYTPVFTVTDFGGCTRTQTFVILIQMAPVASFSFFNTLRPIETGTIGGTYSFCAPFSPSVISLTSSQFPLGYLWNLGYGGPINSLDSTAFTNYPKQPGNYTISLNAYTRPALCASSTSAQVTIFAPEIDFVLEPDSLKKTYCLGEPITVSLTTFPGVSYYKWDFGDGVVSPRIYPLPTIPLTLKTTYANAYFPYSTNGELTIELVGYAGQEPTVCKDVKRKKVTIIRVLPDFDRNNELLTVDSIHCLNIPDYFKNLSSTNSTGVLNYTWTCSNGFVTSLKDVPYTFAQPGTYTMNLLSAEPTNSCIASVSKKMVIHPLPSANLSISPSACPGIPFEMNGNGTPGETGILTGTVFPTDFLDPIVFSSTNTFTTKGTASVSTTYTLKVTDTNGCEMSASTASIYIQQPAPRIDWDTAIVVGQQVQLNAYAGPNFSYTWTPLVDYLNCDTCLFYNPVSNTTLNITYSVMVEDGLHCSIVKNTYSIKIIPKVSLDVPSAFTPNGDGINDVIFPDGWGIRKLIYFKVFNRWGQLVFESNDLKMGWDGNFGGVPQNMDTYVYQVSVETFLDSEPILNKAGTFKLLR